MPSAVTLLRTRKLRSEDPDFEPVPCIDNVDMSGKVEQDVAAPGITRGRVQRSVQEIRGEAGTWNGDNVRAVVKKWGNSASVRIPAAVMQAARLELNEAGDVREQSGRIVIEPVRPREYALGDLLKQITSKNLHEEVEFGPASGKEAW
jgi:antitoxin MazE